MNSSRKKAGAVAAIAVAFAHAIPEFRAEERAGLEAAGLRSPHVDAPPPHPLTFELAPVQPGPLPLPAPSISDPILEIVDHPASADEAVVDAFCAIATDIANGNVDQDSELGEFRDEYEGFPHVDEMVAQLELVEQDPHAAGIYFEHCMPYRP